MLNPHISANRGLALAILWIFMITNVLFKDVHELAKASTINEILSGYFYGNPVTDIAIFLGAFGVEIMLLSVPISVLAAHKIARRYNLFASVVMLPTSLLVPPRDMDDYFFAAVTVVTLIIIFSVAWLWKTADTSRADQSYA